MTSLLKVTNNNGLLRQIHDKYNYDLPKHKQS